ncbi:peptidase U32 family protein [Streptococcus sp. CSL10205-OR2]|uniref:peptidase U32 family protein n=1 Tax=Streptococcus sp. CSL10205-OR2 TaxID=2980558 RepID=UPI0021D9566E|nr:peptidase U32 family protein [Streptococcus sp. CSL10205-OR2]MCU9532920.1 U32 family peptidase [Streptococcus sp. CSL10205-OR2]
MSEMILTATAESIEQTKQLLELGVDRIYIGEKNFGLRLPNTFERDEMNEIATLVHQKGKKLTVAVNALMHQGMIDRLPDYLDFLESIKTDYITVGDTGVIYLINQEKRPLKMIYDASTMVTSSRQINFWGKVGKVSEAVLAREIPSEELFKISQNLDIPAEVLIYGASVIHHSKRPLLQNYYNFTKIDDDKTKARDLFLAEPSDPNSHYSIYEDNHGTHVFANNDINLMTKLNELVAHGLAHWKLDGIYTPETSFTEIVSYFVKARDLISLGQFDQAQAFLFDEKIQENHPKNRQLDTGFYDFDPNLVK